MLLQEKQILIAAELEKIASCVSRLLELSADSTNIFFALPSNLGSEIRKELYRGTLAEHKESLKQYVGGEYCPNEDIEHSNFDVLLFVGHLHVQFIFLPDETVGYEFRSLGDTSLKKKFIDTLHPELQQKMSAGEKLSWNEVLELLESKSSF